MAEPDLVEVLISFDDVDNEAGVDRFYGSSYEAVGDRLSSFSINMGRNPNDIETCQPGTATIVLHNDDNAFSQRHPDRQYGTRPMDRIKIAVRQTPFTTSRTLFTGYVDSYVRSYPGGGSDQIITITATDYMKVLSRRVNDSPGGVPDPQKTAAQRIKAILDGVGVPSALQRININNYASRTVVAKAYDNENTLSAVQEMQVSDGGLFFVDGDGLLTYQTYAFRANNPSSVQPQADFGNFSPSDLPVESDIDFTVDDQLLVNRVYVTAANGTRPQADDLTAQQRDGIIVFELGDTQLLQVDAEARADELLARRGNAIERTFSITLNNLTDDLVQSQALARRLSDRISLNIRGDDTFQQYYVESISHEYTAARSFTTTWSLSAVSPFV